MIALKVSGELENQSDLYLNEQMYPTGQVIRGALGYVFLDMGLGISETYLKDQRAVLYFRDAHVKHHDGGLLLPIGGGGKIFKCSVCGAVMNNTLKQDNIMGIHIGNDEKGDNSFYNKAIVGKYKFNFEVILNMKPLGDNKEEQRLADLIAAIKFVEANGINIGRRHDKGHGKMSLKNVKMKEVVGVDIYKRSDEIAYNTRMAKGKLSLHFVSDLVTKASIMKKGSAVSGTDILRDIKNCAKFFGYWTEGKIGYQEPEISIVRRENDTMGSVEFLDYKCGTGIVDARPLKNRENVIVRGAKFECLLNGGKDIENLYGGNDKYKKWFDALAACEMFRGIGDRIPFGKGEFRVE